MKTYIAQSPAPPTVPQLPPLAEWISMGAIAFFVIRECLGWLKSKDASESQMTERLINDLRTERQQQWQQMGKLLLDVRQSNAQTAQAILQISKAINDINRAIQQDSRSKTETFAAIQRLEHQVMTLNTKLDASQTYGLPRNRPTQPESRSPV